MKIVKSHYIFKISFDFYLFSKILDKHGQLGYNQSCAVKQKALQKTGKYLGGCVMPKNLELSYLLDFYGTLLSDSQRAAMEYYYNDDLSLAEIASILNISRQGVRDAVKRAESALLEYEDRMGLRKRFDRIQNELNTIRSAAEKIKFVTDDKTVKNCADLIIQTTEALDEG